MKSLKSGKNYKIKIHSFIVLSWNKRQPKEMGAKINNPIARIVPCSIPLKANRSFPKEQVDILATEIRVEVELKELQASVWKVWIIIGNLP